MRAGHSFEVYQASPFPSIDVLLAGARRTCRTRELPGFRQAHAKHNYLDHLTILEEGFQRHEVRALHRIEGHESCGHAVL